MAIIRPIPKCHICGEINAREVHKNQSNIPPMLQIYGDTFLRYESIDCKCKKMNKKLKVYIASPYTKGDVAVNVKKQIDCFDELMTLGFAPYAPLYSHFQHMVHPRPYEDWIEIDKIWVLVCDCILRLPGDSSGADGEVKLAQENNIPVFYNINDLCIYKNKI